MHIEVIFSVLLQYRHLNSAQEITCLTPTREKETPTPEMKVMHRIGCTSCIIVSIAIYCSCGIIASTVS